MTTRRLVIMRHGEALPSLPVKDKNRPLSAAGLDQVASVARLLKAEGWVPECLLVSPAQRTTQTANEILRILQIGQSLAETVENFYLATHEQLQDRLQTLSDNVHTVIAIGHNPGWSEAIHYFTDKHETLPTGGAALIQCKKKSWFEAVEDNEWKFVKMLVPSQGG